MEVFPFNIKRAKQFWRRPQEEEGEARHLREGRPQEGRPQEQGLQGREVLSLSADTWVAERAVRVLLLRWALCIPCRGVQRRAHSASVCRARCRGELDYAGIGQEARCGAEEGGQGHLQGAVAFLVKGLTTGSPHRPPKCLKPSQEYENSR